MSAHRDEIDRAIDEALSAAVSGEPLRVNAASVRRGLPESRRSTLPVWLAVAAVLLVGIAVTLREPAGDAQTPALVLRPGESRIPGEGPKENSPSPSPVAVNNVASRKTTRPLAVNPKGRLPQGSIAEGGLEEVPEEAYEGLPRLTIASLGDRELLTTRALDAEILVIPAIEIAPLSVSSLSNEQEH